MIAVVADDFSGAAETAGVAFRHGLDAEVALEVPAAASAAVVAVDTDTRALQPEAAADCVRRTFGALRAAETDWLYKKIDSVLRGPLVAELTAALEALGLARALVVPANPQLGRAILDGRYVISGVPLDETGFRDDPEHPARSSWVLDLVGRGARLPVRVIGRGGALPERGIAIAEAESVEDLAVWAARLDSATLAAGAAPFFGEILRARLGESRRRTVALGSSGATLFVVGSRSDASRRFVADLQEHGVAVLGIPDAAAAIEALEQRGAAALALPRNAAGLVASVLARVAVERIFIEGGGTASAVVRQLGWRRLEVVAELAPGAVALRPLGQAGPTLFTKPGSYCWPDAILGAILGGSDAARP